MLPYTSPLMTALPNSLEVQQEIVKAMHAFVAEHDEGYRQRKIEIASIRRELEEINQDVRKLQSEWPSLVCAELCKYGYDPEQPRIPKHQAGGGEWTQVAGSDDRNDATAAPPFPRQPYADGHHWVPEGVFNKFKLREDTREVFDNARSGALADPTVNRFTREHRKYNDAVEQALRSYLVENGITDEQMTPEQAETFYRRMRGSNDPVIGGLNRKIIRQRLGYIEYFYLRGGGDEE